MKALYILDAVLWIVNSAVWYGYAHNTAMAVTSAVAAIAVVIVAGRIE